MLLSSIFVSFEPRVLLDGDPTAGDPTVYSMSDSMISALVSNGFAMSSHEQASGWMARFDVIRSSGYLLSASSSYKDPRVDLSAQHDAKMRIHTFSRQSGVFWLYRWVHARMVRNFEMGWRPHHAHSNISKRSSPTCTICQKYLKFVTDNAS
jgi:hypothetical protein